MKLQLCHRLPERSFHIRGHQFPVCARCTGMYIGATAYLIYVQYVPITYTASMVVLGLLLITPAGIDGTTQALRLRKSNNHLRLVTGLLLGVGTMILARTTREVIKWTIIIIQTH